MNEEILPPSENTTLQEKNVIAQEVSAQYRVLARKYRPQNFDDLIGQETLVRVLRRAFEIGRVAHAFMLTGERGVGKTTTARIIARALNCVGEDGLSGPTANPCGKCHNCQAILADRHPDVLEMDAASRTGVADIREIIEAARYRPLQARMKVFVIDEVHMLSKPAFNALLKTLEEPPEQITFIFATTELRKIPITVLSRCQRFDLQRVPQKILAEHFAQIAQKENISLPEEVFAIIARVADGSVRDGLSVLDQVIAQGAHDVDSVMQMLGLADRALSFDLFEASMSGNAAKILEITEYAYRSGADLSVLINDLLELVHLLTRFKIIPSLREGREISELERLRGGALADRLSMSVLGRAWQILLKGLSEIADAPDTRQAVEMLLIRLCHASLLPTPDKIIRQFSQTSAKGGEMSQNAPLAIPPQGALVQTQSVQRTGQMPSAPSASLNTPHTAMSAPPIMGRGFQGGEEGHKPSLRLVANGGAVLEKQEAPLEEGDQKGVSLPRSWRELVGLVRENGSLPWLHGILRYEAHLVSFAPPRLVLRIDDPAIRRRAFRELMAFLGEIFAVKWVLEASEAQGAPSLDEQGEKVVALHRHAAEHHPLVQAILTRFPDAVLGEVRDPSLDIYGLPAEEFTVLGEDAPPDLEFAPYDADSIEEDDLS